MLAPVRDDRLLGDKFVSLVDDNADVIYIGLVSLNCMLG